MDRANGSGRPALALSRGDRTGQGEIVVCAVRPEDFSTKVDDPYDFAAQLQQGMGLAAIGLSNRAVLAAEVEQVDIGGGAVSNRVMIR